MVLCLFSVTASHVFSWGCMVQSMRSKIDNRSCRGMFRITVKSSHGVWSFFTSIFLKVCTNSFGSCSPFRSVHGCLQSYQYLWGMRWDFTFECFWSTFVDHTSSALYKFQLTIENFFWESISAHPDNMTSPSKLSFDDHCLGDCFHSFKDV